LRRRMHVLTQGEAAIKSCMISIARGGGGLEFRQPSFPPSRRVRFTPSADIRPSPEGTRFGRKPKLTKHQAREALKRVAAGEPLRDVDTPRSSAQGTVRCRGHLIDR